VLGSTLCWQARGLCSAPLGEICQPDGHQALHHRCDWAAAGLSFVLMLGDTLLWQALSSASPGQSCQPAWQGPLHHRCVCQRARCRSAVVGAVVLGATYVVQSLASKGCVQCSFGGSCQPAYSLLPLFSCVHPAAAAAVVCCADIAKFNASLAKQLGSDSLPPLSSLATCCCCCCCCLLAVQKLPSSTRCWPDS
jgi:hypothetical protein